MQRRLNGHKTKRWGCHLGTGVLGSVSSITTLFGRAARPLHNKFNFTFISFSPSIVTYRKTLHRANIPGNWRNFLGKFGEISWARKEGWFKKASCFFTFSSTPRCFRTYIVGDRGEEAYKAVHARCIAIGVNEAPHIRRHEFILPSKPPSIQDRSALSSDHVSLPFRTMLMS